MLGKVKQQTVKFIAGPIDDRRKIALSVKHPAPRGHVIFL